MMPSPSARDSLIALLRQTHAPSSLSPEGWSQVVATARNANLIGSLGELMVRLGWQTGCNADRHLDGARQLSGRQRSSVRWEAQCIHDALSGLGVPVVLLKGAAYAMGGHRNSFGRLFGDVDILVPSEALGDVEIQLMVNGWTSIKSEDYDDRYYRQWMHELPPMMHVRRGSVIDVHHTILPPTARHQPQARRIIDRATPLPDLPALRIPCPEDLIIHSLTHLVHEGELHNGLRDLYDIHLLIETHCAIDGFWQRLVEYAREHDLTAPVGLGLSLAMRFMKTPIPENIIVEFGPGPGRVLRTLYDWALRPQPDSGNDWQTQVADFALYVRAHWLRMPPALLLKHLARKALLRMQQTASRDPGPDDATDRFPP